MKRLTLIVAVVLFSLPASVFAAPPRLAVGDFSVTSDDPRLKYVGKGLAEMVAAEIASSDGHSASSTQSAKRGSWSTSGSSVNYGRIVAARRVRSILASPFSRIFHVTR